MIFKLWTCWEFPQAILKKLNAQYELSFFDFAGALMLTDDLFPRGKPSWLHNSWSSQDLLKCYLPGNCWMKTLNCSDVGSRELKSNRVYHNSSDTRDILCTQRKHKMKEDHSLCLCEQCCFVFEKVSQIGISLPQVKLRSANPGLPGRRSKLTTSPDILKLSKEH